MLCNVCRPQLVDTARFAIISQERKYSYASTDLRDAKVDLRQAKASGEDDLDWLTSEVDRLTKLRRSIEEAFDGPDGLDSALANASANLKAATEVDLATFADPPSPSQSDAEEDEEADAEADAEADEEADAEAVAVGTDCRGFATAATGTPPPTPTVTGTTAAARSKRASPSSTDADADALPEATPAAKKPKRVAAVKKAAKKSAAPDACYDEDANRLYEVDVIKSRSVKGKWRFKVIWLVSWDPYVPSTHPDWKPSWISKRSLGTDALKHWKEKNGGKIEMDEGTSPSCTLWSCTLGSCPTLSCTTSCCTTRTVLYHSALYHSLLYHSLLYHSVLYHSLLYHSVL